MNIIIYLRKGIVYLPTSRRIPGSYYKHTEPVQVAPATDVAGVIGAFERAFEVGNPLITEQEAVAFPNWITKARTGVTSWSAFERGLLSWDVGTHPKTGEYRMFSYGPMKGGGRTRNEIPEFTLPADTPISEVIRRASEVVCDAAKRLTDP